MLNAFLKFLGGEPGEERQMWLLLGKGFFMGVFLATYDVSAQSLFIQEVGSDYLDKAFFVTGGLGIISTVLFVFFQKRINFSTLAISNTLLIFLFIGGCRAAFEFLDPNMFSGFAFMPFILFVMMGPINAITLLGFWGVFGRMFDSRQAKRIIGGIDTGQLTATIIAFFSIPLITRLPFVDNTYDLLFVSAVSAFGVLIFTTIISISWNIDKATKLKKDEVVEKTSYRTVFKDPYQRLLSLFLIFSMGAAIFVDFTFYSATEIMFPEEQKLNDFLSFFNGIVVIMSFLIQSFLNDLIIGRFGLKIALMTYPVILILFTIGGIISGHLYGYEIKTEEYLLFFMFAVSGKAFTFSLRDALEQPAFKLFFLPFNIKIRFDIQTRIEGVVSELATLVAGSIQMALGLLVWFKLIHYAYFVIGLAGMVMWISYLLFNQYKITLKKTLQIQKEQLQDEGKRNEHNTLNMLKSELKKKDEKRVLSALNVLEKIDPIEFEFSLLDQLKATSVLIRRRSYQKLLEYQCFTAINIIEREAQTEEDEETLSIAKKTISELRESVEFELNDISIRKYIRSTEAKDRIKGARLLSKLTEDKHIAYLIELLRDINPEVRNAAMVTAGKLRRPEVWPILIENLHAPVFANSTMSSLVHSGEAAFHNIDTSFYKTGQYQSTMFRIVQVLGRIGGRNAMELLWKKIDFPNKQIVSELLLSLSYNGFEAKDFQGARIKIILESLIGDIAWNIKAIQDIPHAYPVDPMDRMLTNAMAEEDRVNFSNIFMLLGMLYDAQSVVLVKENIILNTTDSVLFAVEMMDVFLEDELKPKLFPVVDDLKNEERLTRLIEFFPPEEFDSYIDLLQQIINRDYNRITRYTKAIALYRLSQLKDAKVTDVLIANLFNPDKLLLQTAAYTIYKLDQGSYTLNTKRLKPDIKKKLDSAILPPVYIEEGEKYHQKLLFVERVFQLKKMVEFKKIPGELITYVADVLDEIMVKEGTVLIAKGAKGNIPIHIVIEGSVDIIKDSEVVKTIKKNGLLGEKLINESDLFDYDAVSTTTTTLLLLNKDNLLDLMSKHVEISEAFIEILNGVEVKMAEMGSEEYDMSLFN